MKGIILAAGLGTKMWPYSEVRNKCATLVCNRPAVWRVAENLVQAGADGLVVVTGHLGQSIRGALFGLVAPVRYLEAPPAEGTALAAARAIRALGDDDTEVVLAFGDVVTSPESVRRTVAALRERGCPAMLVARRAAGERSQDYLNVRVSDGAVRGLTGHSRDGQEHVVGGVFAFRPAEVLPYLEANPGLVTTVDVGAMPPVEADLMSPSEIG